MKITLYNYEVKYFSKIEQKKTQQNHFKRSYITGIHVKL